MSDQFDVIQSQIQKQNESVEQILNTQYTIHEYVSEASQIAEEFLSATEQVLNLQQNQQKEVENIQEVAEVIQSQNDELNRICVMEG